MLGFLIGFIYDAGSAIYEIESVQSGVHLHVRD